MYGWILTHNISLKRCFLTCPVEFSMTCTNGVLVDIFERLEVAKKKGERNSEAKHDSSVSFVHLKSVQLMVEENFQTDVQC